jgi:hypothetical protein
MEPKHAPIDDYEQKALANQHGKERYDTEVPHGSGVNGYYARRVLGEEKSQQHARSRQYAIRRNKNSADVEEDWMHLSKDRASGRRNRIRTDMKSAQEVVEPDPLGRE